MTVRIRITTDTASNFGLSEAINQLDHAEFIIHSAKIEDNHWVITAEREVELQPFQCEVCEFDKAIESVIHLYPEIIGENFGDRVCHCN